MVLVSNEWQNKSEDVPKTTANTTTTTAGTAATTSSTAAGAATANIAEQQLTGEVGTVVNATTNSKQTETVAGDPINSIIAETETVISSREIAIPGTTTAAKTLANDNANNEQQQPQPQKLNEIVKKDKNSIEIAYKNELNEIEVDADINEYKIAEIGKINTTKQQLKEQEDSNLNETVLNYNNTIKIMAENTKESPLKEEKELEEESQQQTNTLINTLNHMGNNKDLEESNSYPNSNTNTLTTAPIQTIKTQQNNQQQNIITQQVPLSSCPITPQALSSALQTALNNTNNANNQSVAAAGLQPNFLSQLALTANVAGLQKPIITNTAAAANSNSLTAKQLNQSFNMLDTNQTNQNKSDSNLLEGGGSTTTTLSSTTATAATVPAVTYDNNGQAKIVLICEGNSHPFQTRTISLTPNVECMVGRLIAKSKASENNAIFDCKVLSRKHAVIWYTPDGKFWVKDTKSSNGTFINDNKLGDEEAELHFGDIVKFGVDVLENSRKEVHGCIIACVKLYLPDGREAISIDTTAHHRSPYSGEGRISYDELHRLNLYIQETSQREKVLTSKLCNIQNVLDATRKNSALCWQSMITEDQLLHRIHSLEKKLQFMEKNVPENLLRNEVLKLLDDKTSYQHTAKEALRKVYQERCDAMQMLAKMESAYTQSDNECSLLRDQIMNSKQTLQEVNTRLLRLETEYNEYKDEAARLQQEAKEREEQRIVELSEKLRERELECEDLKKKISELLIKRAELLENEEQLLEKQAIEKLDAAIADMDLGDDEDSSDDDDDDDGDVDENDALAMEKSENKRNGNNADIEAKEEDDTQAKFAINRKKSKIRPHLTSIFGEQLNGVEEEQNKAKLKKAKAFDASKEKTSPKRVKETTIMKWLQNSDLNKNEGSFDIFKAICNENENEDGDIDGDNDNEGECEAGLLTETKLKQAKPTQMPEELYNNFTSKLKNVQKNLKQLEAEIENETAETGNETSAKVKQEIKVEEEQEELDSSDEEDADEEGACAEQEFIIKRNGKSSTSSVKQVLSKENKKYLLLKSSVNMLREAYNEIWDSVREQEHKYNDQQPEGDKEKSPPPNIKVKTQFPTYATSPSKVASKKFEQSPTAIRSSASDITESDSEVESITLSSPVDSSHSATVINMKTDTTNDELLLQQLKEYKLQVGTLNEKLQQTELEAQHTLEIMQVECDDVKLKMENLNKIIESLKNDKKALEQVITENNKNNSEKLETTSAIATTPLCPEIDVQLAKELELEEDPVLNAINVTALEREEELITYKERLDQQQRENIDLRNEIALLKLKANNPIGTTKDVWLKQYLPCSFVILAIIIYFLTTYY